MNTAKALTDGVKAFAQAVVLHRAQTGDMASPLVAVTATFNQTEGTATITGRIGGCAVSHAFEVRLGQRWRLADGMAATLAVWAIAECQRACRE